MNKSREAFKGYGRIEAAVLAMCGFVYQRGLEDKRAQCAQEGKDAPNLPASD